MGFPTSFGFFGFFGVEPPRALIIIYFEKTWVGNISKRPLYPAERWNQRERILLQLMTTNNNFHLPGQLQQPNHLGLALLPNYGTIDLREMNTVFLGHGPPHGI